MSSSSVSAGARSSPAARTAGGIASKRASTDAIPRASSIRLRSPAVCGPYAISGLRDQRLVGDRVEEAVHLRRVGQADAEHPARPVRVGVDHLGRRRQRAVRLDDLAADRGEQVADGLHRLDDAERGELLQRPPGGGQLDEDDVAELVGGVLR